MALTSPTTTYTTKRPTAAQMSTVLKPQQPAQTVASPVPAPALTGAKAPVKPPTVQTPPLATAKPVPRAVSPTAVSGALTAAKPATVAPATTSARPVAPAAQPPVQPAAPQPQPQQAPPVQQQSPGITGGVQQTQMAGIDMTGKGPAEQFFDENAWRFMLPNSQTEQGAYWQNIMPQVATPGVAEGAYGQVAPQLIGTGQGENYANVAGSVYRPGNYPTGTNLSSDVAARFPGEAPGVSNEASSFYRQNFLPNMPDINADPGLDPYYDNARRKAAEQINQQMAARGLWGSSAAGDMISEANVNLGAEQANREAQYYLDRLGEQRAWQGLGGDLASSADTSSGRVADNERQWRGLEADVSRSADDVTARNADLERTWVDSIGNLGLQGDAAQRARLQTLMASANDAQSQNLARLGFGADMSRGLDQSEFQRLSAGMSGAAQAQGAQRQRGQDYFGNTMAMGGAMSDLMGSQYNPMITEDKALLDDIMAMLTGSGAERLSGASRETAGAQNSTNQTQQLAMTLLLLGLL